MPNIQLAGTRADIEHCFPVMHELRPHLDLKAFADQVERQQSSQGYELAYLEADGQVMAVAGFRVVEMLAWGKAVYVDDLVTTSASRSGGHGGAMLDWLVDRARSYGCGQFHLDSGVQRFDAHRFYLRKRMDIICHHFAMNLK